MVSVSSLFVQLLLCATLFIATISALKPEDCEGKKVFKTRQSKHQLIYILCSLSHWFFVSVCFKVVDRLSKSLSDDIRKDPKKIEEEFKKFCKGSKSKENRFVSKLDHLTQI